MPGHKKWMKVLDGIECVSFSPHPTLSIRRGLKEMFVRH